MTHKKIKIFCSLFLGLALAGCAPFIDTRREAGQVAPVGQSTPDRPAVCYNPLWSDADELRSLADSACTNDKKATPDEVRYFNCRLFTPNTAFFKCR